MSRYQNSGSQSAPGTRRLRRGGREGAPTWSAAWTAAATSSSVQRTTTPGLEALKAVARRRLAAERAELDLGPDCGGRAAAGGPLPITSSRMGHLWDALVRAYGLLGLEQALCGRCAGCCAGRVRHPERHAGRLDDLVLPCRPNLVIHGHDIDLATVGNPTQAHVSRADVKPHRDCPALNM